MLIRLQLIAAFFVAVFVAACFAQDLTQTGVGSVIRGGGGPSTTTFDPAHTSTAITLSGGNLVAAGNATAQANTRSVSCHSSGKYYAEFVINASGGADEEAVGFMSTSDGTATGLGGTTNRSVGLYGADVHVYINNVSVASIFAFNIADTISMAVDIGNTNIWYRLNSGNWNINASANPATNTLGISFSGISGAPYCAAVLTSTTTGKWTANFGGSAYSFSVPSGFGNW